MLFCLLFDYVSISMHYNKQTLILMHQVDLCILLAVYIVMYIICFGISFGLVSCGFVGWLKECFSFEGRGLTDPLCVWEH